ncbi:MAG: WbqC family protein [Bacteroidetes bacterium]|nr:WbqC family protein [Bacteroidota bacterium]
MADEKIIVSTAYFPPIGYISALVKAEEVVIDLDETYPKQTCRNHTNICGPNGRQTLSIPVNKPGGNHTKSRDIRISYALPWRKTHLRSLEAAYSNSPFFLYYQDYFRPVFEKKYDFLADINSEILEILYQVLRISGRISFAETYIRHPEGMRDLRNELTAKQAMAICKPYTQTFSEKHGFIPNLSILDLIFNLGEEATEYLQFFVSLR